VSSPLVDHAPVALGLGCVRLGHPASGGRRGAARLVGTALDLGIVYFDTADSYGQGASETALGLALRGRREAAIVATKVGYLFDERARHRRALRHVAAPVLTRLRPQARSLSGALGAYRHQDFSPAYLRRALEASLRRLRTDYVDLYQLHGPPGPCGDDVIELMVDLRSQGKIRDFGVGLERLDDAISWQRTEAVSSLLLPYGLLDPEAALTVIPAASARSITVTARGAFASGLLARSTSNDSAWLRPGQAEQRAAVHALAAELGVDALQLAMWFVAGTPGVSRVLVGTTSAAHLAGAAHYLSCAPPEGAYATLAEVAGIPAVPSGRAQTCAEAT
jgi:aryl-alcohol dehydrogenase-like predicted oxidoreductase